jgi:hypothetical protein
LPCCQKLVVRLPTPSYNDCHGPNPNGCEVTHIELVGRPRLRFLTSMCRPESLPSSTPQSLDRATFARCRLRQSTHCIGVSTSAPAWLRALDLGSLCGSLRSSYGDGPATQDEHDNRGFLAALVERVTFHSVLRVKARGQRDLITVLGHAAMISAGEFVQASGNWINDRTHGVQFKASFLKAAPPTTIEGIEKYLSSGMIRGIGPVYAKKLVRAFGEAVFDVIQRQPDRLCEVTGIGPKELSANFGDGLKDQAAAWA